MLLHCSEHIHFKDAHKLELLYYSVTGTALMMSLMEDLEKSLQEKKFSPQTFLLSKQSFVCEQEVEIVGVILWCDIDFQYQAL